jgi:hypothetical protein
MVEDARALGVNSIIACLVLATSVSAATLRVEGQKFRLDAKPFDMWGIRTASASQSEEYTRHLVEQLDEYRRHGVNTVSVYYMGSNGGYSDPFSADGKSIDPDHQARMVSILKEADRRGMVVVVGIFYQRSNPPRLNGWDAAREAVRTVAGALKPHRNVILNIANEQNSRNYRGLPWERVNNVADVIELCRLIKRTDPERVVGAGGYDHAKNEELGRSGAVDVLLFDTNGPEDSGVLYDRFRAAGVKKPMVNVETFGAWTNKFVPAGVFPDEVKEAYRREVQAAAQHEGLYLHFHNSPWLQSAQTGQKNRYDLGGEGTASKPGIRWYFEMVKEVTGSLRAQ